MEQEEKQCEVEHEFSVKKPLNREPDLGELVSSYITPATPKAGGYDRNHGPIPFLSASTHTLTINGLVRHPISLSIHDLRTLFPQHTIVAALQCAGNRRHTMRTKLKEVWGVDWGDGAVLNAVWRGPLLRDVLSHVGLDTGGRERCAANKQRNIWWEQNGEECYKGLHVAFASYQTLCEDDGYYGGSIPLSRAMRADADVILALDMNGTPLTPYHGFPVRALVPGVAGARCVKWLDRITVQCHESTNFYQTMDYKILPEWVVTKEMASKQWLLEPAIEDMPINSVVALPKANSAVFLDSTDGTVEVTGYALPSGEDGPVVRVEVSGDEGKSWIEAEILKPQLDSSVPAGVSLKWAWVLWRARVKMRLGEGGKIWSRATDKARNAQCSNPQWNLRGCCYNGYGEAEGLTVMKPAESTTVPPLMARARARAEL